MKTEGETSLYRQILKGTAVFGGTQMLTMLTNIVKGKFVALILSEYGMGLSALMQSALNPMQQLFSMGLPSSVVKDIAAEQDAMQRAAVVKAFRRVLLLLAVLGMLTMFIGASAFSMGTFGNTDYTSWFVAMSVALFFFILAGGETAVLQGCRRLKEYAVCNIAAALCGLLIGVPLYYFYGVGGIVPSMVILSFSMFLTARIFTRRIGLPAVVQSLGESVRLSRGMLLLGFAMMLSGLTGALTLYLINTFIRKNGGVSDVGLYQAACSITLQATALVFTAMAADYYPHLSSLTERKSDLLRLVRSEAEVVVCVMAPVISLLIVLSPVVVEVLLTTKFNPIVPLIRLIALSFWGRALCFPLDYVCMARGDRRFFFWTQGVWSNVKTLLLSVGAYWLWGLNGLGYAALAGAVIDIAVSLTLNHWRYGVCYSFSMLKVVLPFFILNVGTLLAAYFMDGWAAYLAMSMCTILVCVFACVLLHLRLRKIRK